MSPDRSERIHSLAVGMVEAATEWDFAEVPEEVRVAVLEAARVFVDWLDASSVVVSSSGEPVTPDSRIYVLVSAADVSPR